MSKLTPSERRIFIAAIVVVVGGLAAIIDAWGIGGIVGGLAGLGAVLVLLQPQMMPAMQLPAPKPTLLLALGVVAAIGFIVSALQYSDYISRFGRVFTLLFDVGLVASLALAYLAWLNSKALQPAATPAAAAPASENPQPPAAV
jgi:hypothetical protein